MIINWRLANFKSVREKTELELGPLTIFAGNNSSGKSTVLQSILLISQTLASKVGSRSVVLNGHLTKLGQFDDLKSNNSEKDFISIGWDCVYPYNRPTLKDISDLPLRFNESNAIYCDISFDVDKKQQIELRQLQPRLIESLITTGTVRPNGTVTVAKLEGKRRKNRAKKLEEIKEINFTRRIQNYSRDDLKGAQDFLIGLDKEYLASLKGNHRTGEVKGCLFRHFLPEHLLISYDKKAEEAELFESVICRQEFRFTSLAMKTRPNSFQREFVDKPFPERVITLLQEHLGEDFTSLLRPTLIRLADAISSEPEARPLTIYQWLTRVERLSSERREKLYQLVNGLEGEISEAINPNKIGFIEQDTFRIPARIEASVNYLDSFFTRSVKYLGPLRDEPKPLYPLAAAVDPADIGLRGEFTAAVLDIHKGQTIKYIPTACFERAEVKPVVDEENTLAGAVKDWLNYLGVAEEFETIDRGKLGHELKVKLNGAKAAHDLTHVGVGVSQVLPILVACLLAERDTTLIFEQPELHLHPKVQTLLGDFFLSMALLGKQCIIETHSEYLINRLRYRIAAAVEQDLASEITMYFVEKKDGNSEFNKVEISEYGAIENWPEGFFDQSQDEAERILRAATKKRRAELKKNG